MKKILFIAALACLSVAAIAADPPVHKEGRMIGTYTYANDIGRVFGVESILFAPNGDSSVTNTITVKLINTQDIDLTGTNPTPTAVSFTLGTVSVVGGTPTSLTPTVAYRIPADGTLLLTNAAVNLTNDFIIVRKAIQ